MYKCCSYMGEKSLALQYYRRLIYLDSYAPAQYNFDTKRVFDDDELVCI